MAHAGSGTSRLPKLPSRRSGAPTVGACQGHRGAKGNATAKFDETMDMARGWGWIRSTPTRWSGNGRASSWDRQKVRVLVFAKGEKEKEAQTPGRLRWSRGPGREDPGRLLDFDRAIATPDVMGLWVAWEVLGPRGLMPNPRPDRHLRGRQAVREFKGGKIEFRVEKAGIIHVPFARPPSRRSSSRRTPWR